MSTTYRRREELLPRLLLAILASADAESDDLVLAERRGPSLFRLVAMASGEEVFLVASNETSPQVYKSLVKEAIRRSAQGARVHFLLVGSDKGPATHLKSQIPLQAHLTCHVLEDDETLVEVRGPSPAWLRLAVARLADVPSPTPARIEAELERGAAAKKRRTEIVRLLRGNLRGTATIALVNVAIFAMLLHWSGGNVHASILLEAGALGGHLSAEPYRLVAYGFLHGGLVPLGLDLLSLWILGPFVEAVLGTRRFLLLYVVSTLGAGLASSIVGAPWCTVGAGGAIAGLCAARVTLALHRGNLLPRFVKTNVRPTLIAVALGLGLQIATPALLGPIDWVCSVGGALTGSLLVFSVLLRQLRPLAERKGPRDVERGSSRAMSTLAVLGVGAMAVCLGAAFARGRPWRHLSPPKLERTRLGATGLVIALPEELRAEPEGQPGTGVQTFRFASPERSPLVVEVKVATLSMPPSGKEEAALFRERGVDELPSLGVEVVNGELVRAAPRFKFVPFQNRRAAWKSVPYEDGSTRTTYVFFVDRFEVELTMTLWKSRPKGLTRIEETVAESVAIVGP